MSLVAGKTGKWEVVVGLEIHAQVLSKSKLFSGAATQFGSEPNSQVSLVDAAMPGVLPVLNEYCVEQAVRTGLGLEAQINLVSAFDRKNYFYADLPQGYQISQFYHSIIGKGVVEVDLPNGTTTRVGITRIHLEQDAGKSIHDQHPTLSLIDLNRCGIALMEIVTEPDIRSSIEAGEFVKKLRSILRYLGTCDGDMEKGSMRCDANVSVRKPGEVLGNRCEVKNLNSIRNVIRAIDYEVTRQIEVLEDGGKIDQETKLFNANIGTTRTIRTKENANRYRYFPDPDLLPLKLTKDYVERIKNSLPELPNAKKKRYIIQMGLSPYDAAIISADKEVANYFEQVVKQVEPKLAANWITAELFARLNKADLEINESKVTAEKFINLLKLITDNTISGKLAKQVFEIMFETGEDASTIVEREGLKQVTDLSAIEQVIDQVIKDHSSHVAAYKAGKDKLFDFFVGQVMKLSSGKLNPQAVNDILKKKLS